MIETVDVAIVGGGIAGLATAHALMKQAPDLRVTLLEAGDRLGGKALTEQIDTDHGRFLIEHGPDAVLTQKPWALDLIRELGLDDDLVPINRVPSPVAVLRGGRIVPMPRGLSLVTPTALGPFLRSPLLNPRERARTLLDLVRPAAPGDADESLAAFVRRRFGPGLLDAIAEPIAAGIYNADPAELSLLATFPRLRDQEREHGSLIRAARAATRGPKPSLSPPAFMTLRAGMQSLTDALASRVARVARTGATVTRLERYPLGGYVLTASDWTRLRARRLVLATPAAVASTLLAGLAPDASQLLASLRTRSAGSLAIAVPDDAFTHPLAGYGLVVAASEGRPFNAVTVASVKFPGRAPEGWTLLRVFFGGARSPRTMALADAALTDTLLAELRPLLGVQGDPAFARVTRWPSGSPQYDVGHLERVAAIERALPDAIAVTGAPYRGVGLPDVVNQAARCAAAVADSLTRTAIYA